MSVVRRRAAIAEALAAILIAAAIIGQLVFSLSLEPPDVAFFLTNFFSFFTILSNISAVLALACGAWYLWRAERFPTWFVTAFAAAVTYMAATGIVYNTLLRGVSLDQESTLGWSNEVLHLVGPILVVGLWLLVHRRDALRWSHVFVAAVFPVVWAVYTLIRGALTGWYPYPFLNPAQPGGYGAVAVYVVAIAGIIIGIDALLIWGSRRVRAGS